MVYQFKPGSRFAVKAQVVGERLEELTRRNGGSLTPALVVDDARDEGSPLHPAFEWDDPTAAEKHREEQARRLIRGVYVVHEGREGSDAVLNYVHVITGKHEPVYMETVRVLDDAELTAQVVEEALRAFQALRARWAHLRALKGVFEAIDRAARGAGRKRKARDGRAAARA